MDHAGGFVFEGMKVDQNLQCRLISGRRRVSGRRPGWPDSHPHHWRRPVGGNPRDIGHSEVGTESDSTEDLGDSAHW